MNHDEIKSKLDEFIDNELPEDQSREIVRHVAACPECGRAVTDYKKAAAFFFARTEVPEDRGFTARVMAALRERAEGLPRPLAALFSLLFQWKTAAALATLLLLWLGFSPARSNGTWETALASAGGTERWLFSDRAAGQGEWAQWILDRSEPEANDEI